MSEHPIRLVVTDDLRRTRFTVALRAILAIPHYVWLLLWSIVAFLATVLNWLATLLLGRSPQSLHRFLAAYLKYVTQFYAYMRIASNPYPSFDGPDGYPVDLQIAPPARQRRLVVLLRLPLALPALLIGQGLGGGLSTVSRSRGRTSYSANGLGWAVSVAGWFVSLARGRTSRGLRDTAVWSIGYGAQLWAYLLMLTDRYPDSDPLALLPEVPSREDPVSTRSQDELRRSRLTVLFRLPLCFPHIVWLALWGVLAFAAAILNWIATLVAGTSPAALHRFLSRFVRCLISFYAFLFVIAGPFPGFAGADGAYPGLETVIAPAARQNRWKTAFRLILVIPAWAISGAYFSLLFTLGVLCWFTALVRGRVPRGMRTAGAVALRYHAATTAYLLLLTDAYPYTGPLRTDGPLVEPPRESPAGPDDRQALPVG
jgi:hypothetical protein